MINSQPLIVTAPNKEDAIDRHSGEMIRQVVNGTPRQCMGLNEKLSICDNGGRSGAEIFLLSVFSSVKD
jgi:hypothetical protein